MLVLHTGKRVFVKIIWIISNVSFLIVLRENVTEMFLQDLLWFFWRIYNKHYLSGKASGDIFFAFIIDYRGFKPAGFIRLLFWRYAVNVLMTFEKNIIILIWIMRKFMPNVCKHSSTELWQGLFHVIRLAEV